MEMKTLDNPIGYKIAPVYLDENANWDSLYAGCEEEERREVIATCKKFIRQVVEGRGYDVDCCPDWTFMSPFVPLEDLKNMKPLYRKIKKAGEFAIWKLNDALIPHTRIRYKLVDVVKVVTEHTWRYLLLTLTAKEIDASECDNDCDADEFEDKFKYGCLDLWGSDRVKRGEKYKEDDDDGEIEDSCCEDGDGAIITVQATVDIYPKRGGGKVYQVTDMMVKRDDSKGYQLVKDLILDLTSC